MSFMSPTQVTNYSSAFSDGREGLGHVLAGSDPDRDDRLSAPSHSVIDLANSSATSMVDECVALTRSTISSLSGTGSTAMARAGSGMGCALHRVDSDAAGAHHDDNVTRLDLGGVRRRSLAGSNTAAELAGLVQRKVIVHLDRRQHRGQGVFGERSESERLAVEAEAEAVVIIPSAVHVGWRRRSCEDS
ncbi:hypothetical protein ACFZC5_36240 [Nocardia gamkensis]|uniref:hypothetical protein n=1 Tax=Nocardia gamkensis TaxID=352869 RepID=UPI0036E41C62